MDPVYAQRVQNTPAGNALAQRILDAEDAPSLRSEIAATQTSHESPKTYEDGLNDAASLALETLADTQAVAIDAERQNVVREAFDLVQNGHLSVPGATERLLAAGNRHAANELLTALIQDENHSEDVAHTLEILQRADVSNELARVNEEHLQAEDAYHAELAEETRQWTQVHTHRPDLAQLADAIHGQALASGEDISAFTATQRADALRIADNNATMKNNILADDNRSRGIGATHNPHRPVSLENEVARVAERSTVTSPRANELQRLKILSHGERDMSELHAARDRAKQTAADRAHSLKVAQGRVMPGGR